MISASDFGKVAVAMGGASAEREISLKSGEVVLDALRRREVDAYAIDVDEDLLRVLVAGGYNRVFIAVHGRGGEDGVLQGALEMLGLPYTGSKVLGAALSMDKLRTKHLWLGAGLPTPEFTVLERDSDFTAIVRRLGLPLMVKPACEGSSIGMAKVTQARQLQSAFESASRFDSCVIAERCIQGSEYTAGILDRQMLPLIRLETPRAFYDYEAKYVADSTRYFCPAGLPAGREREFQELCLRAFEALGCSGWGRVDFLCDGGGRPWLIEANTVPGMTDHSLVPMAAHAAGIGLEDLAWRILETSLSHATGGAEVMYG